MQWEAHSSIAQTLAQTLSEELRTRVARNPRYSLRAFAAALGVSPGELSEMMNGKRKLTLKNALKISRALNYSPEESESFLKLLHEEVAHASGLSPRTEVPHAERRSLTVDLFHLVSEWYCFAIVNLAETKGFRFETRYIAKRLGISATEAKLALDRLERVGLIEREHGKFRVTPDFVLSPEGIPSPAVRKFHAQILDKAKDALETQEIHERDIAGISFAVDPNQIPLLKKEIHELLDRWTNRLDKLPSAEKTEVYHFETALFRLSNPEEKKKSCP